MSSSEDALEKLVKWSQFPYSCEVDYFPRPIL